MARPATGSVVRDDRWSTPTYYARYTVKGQRRKVRLGCEPERTQARAEEELRVRMDRVRRGDDPDAGQAEASRVIPTFSVFANEWWTRQQTEGGRAGNGLTEGARGRPTCTGG